MKITSIREVYHELGEFEIRVVLDEETVSSMLSQSFEMIDSSGKRLKTSSRMWGNKMKCVFVLDESVSDGVMNAQMTIDTFAGERKIVAYAWAIKP